LLPAFSTRKAGLRKLIFAKYLRDLKKVNHVVSATRLRRGFGGQAVLFTLNKGLTNFEVRSHLYELTSEEGKQYSMTSSFVWVLLSAVMVTMFPQAASATTENKTELVFEIKTASELLSRFQPEPTEVKKVKIASIKIEKTVTIPTKKTSYTLPPKVTGDDRVYMHEPEIRAYICPIMGASQCNIFIAILKAENGTHECTRDNRGLNRNGSVDIGLAQINWKPGNPWHTYEQLQDCKYNLDVALEMYERRGFQPWYAYTKGAYKRFLNQAQ
jgi:hypothetical protein